MCSIFIQLERFKGEKIIIILSIHHWAVDRVKGESKNKNLNLIYELACHLQSVSKWNVSSAKY